MRFIVAKVDPVCEHPNTTCTCFSKMGLATAEQQVSELKWETGNE